uniref:DUF6598 domain-containing protein n=1 Tax=Aegilops tauschii TaxID=37682 RepID=M8CJ41_AEGTA
MRNRVSYTRAHPSLTLVVPNAQIVNMRKKVTNAKKLANEVTNVYFPCIISDSTHHDGVIYAHRGLEEDWDIEDRSETLLEPVMFSKATERSNFGRNMLQCFSLRLVECSINNNLIQLYGYIATQNDGDCMVNYVLIRNRDDPIIAHRGSLIQMIGPKGGIEMVYPVLIEFDMRIENGGKEEDDPRLIDGAINCNLYRPWKPVIHRINGDCGVVEISLACVEYVVEATIEVAVSEMHRGFGLSLRPWKPVIHRINGDCGVVEISLACVEYVVEATIEVAVSEMHRGFGLSLRSIVYVWEAYEEIQLFHGTVDQLCGFRRFVLAISLSDVMILKFKLGNTGVELRPSFKVKPHGCSSRQIKHELANISVKFGNNKMFSVVGHQTKLYGCASRKKNLELASVTVKETVENFEEQMAKIYGVALDASDGGDMEDALRRCPRLKCKEYFRVEDLEEKNRAEARG